MRWITGFGSCKQGNMKKSVAPIKRLMSASQSHPLSQYSSCAIGVGELELSHLTDVDSLTFLDLEECAMFTKSERRLVEILTLDHSFCTPKVWPWRNDGANCSEY